MGQYKVPQNVEAEDKILGPLTFKEFIYFLLGFGWAAISFGLFRNIPVLLILIGAPPSILLFLLAFFRKDGQDFEQILLAMVEFFASNRKRYWIKDDVVEAFHIEPTKVAAEQTQRNPVEVRSELEKLANLIDSRGWNEPQQPELQHAALPTTTQAERIVAPPPTPKAPDEVPHDMMDMQQSPLAQNLAELLRQAADDVRNEAMAQMNGQAPKPNAAPPIGTPVIVPGATSQPIAPAPQPAPVAAAPAYATMQTAVSTSGSTPAPASDILQLATKSDDLTVSQLARQATRLVQLPDGQTVEMLSSGN